MTQNWEGGEACLTFQEGGYEVRVCYRPLGITLEYQNKKLSVTDRELSSDLALSSLLHRLGIHIDSKENQKLSFKITNSTELQQILNPKKNAVCVRRFGDGMCKAEVTYSDDKLVLNVYKAEKDNDPVVVDTIPLCNAKIEDVSIVKLKGTNVKSRLLALKVVDTKMSVSTEMVGTLTQIIEYLKEYNLNEKYKFEIAQYIWENSQGVKEMFYSAGPWVVDDKIVIAETSGYMPPWKDLFTFKIEQNGDVERGLTLLKRLVEAYKNPSKAMAVISYGVIAWAKPFFVSEFHYFPHLIITGDNEAGKSLLTDFLRVLFSTDEEISPRKEYQLRKLLSKTTIPAVLTEGNTFISHVKKDDNMMNTLTTSVTMNVLGESGGREYGGLFLGIRSIIIPENIEIDTIAPYFKDKMIIIELPREEGYTDTPSIITPKRMTWTDKAAVRSLLPQILAEFEKALPEIREKLRNGSRETFVNYYLSLGYELLSRIAKRYNIELPKPSTVSLEEEERNQEELIQQAMNIYVNDRKNDIMRLEKDSIVFSPSISALDRYGFYIDVTEGKVVFNTAFVTEFIKELEKRYGIDRMSTNKILRILGATRTQRKFGDKIVNVWAIKLSNYVEHNGTVIPQECQEILDKPVDPRDPRLSICGEYGYYDGETGIFKAFKDDKAREQGDSSFDT